MIVCRYRQSMVHLHHFIYSLVSVFNMKRSRAQNGPKTVCETLETYPFSDWDVVSICGNPGPVRQRPFATREEASEFFRVFNNPGPEIIDRAVDIVVHECSPARVFVYGPTARGYVYGRHVVLLIVVRKGNTMKIRHNLISALADNSIDGDLMVVTEKEFEEYKDDSYSRSYNAVETGYVAYEA